MHWRLLAIQKEPADAASRSELQRPFSLLFSFCSASALRADKHLHLSGLASQMVIKIRVRLTFAIMG